MSEKSLEISGLAYAYPDAIKGYSELTFQKIKERESLFFALMAQVKQL